jgi:hypothetical protein
LAFLGLRLAVLFGSSRTRPRAITASFFLTIRSNGPGPLRTPHKITARDRARPNSRYLIPVGTITTFCAVSQPLQVATVAGALPAACGGRPGWSLGRTGHGKARLVSRPNGPWELPRGEVGTAGQASQVYYSVARTLAALMVWTGRPAAPFAARQGWPPRLSPNEPLEARCQRSPRLLARIQVGRRSDMPPSCRKCQWEVHSPGQFLGGRELNVWAILGTKQRGDTDAHFLRWTRKLNRLFAEAAKSLKS